MLLLITILLFALALVLFALVAPVERFSERLRRATLEIESWDKMQGDK